MGAALAPCTLGLCPPKAWCLCGRAGLGRGRGLGLWPGGPLTYSALLWEAPQPPYCLPARDQRFLGSGSAGCWGAH